MVKLLVVCVCAWLYAGLTCAVVNEGARYSNRWVAVIEGGESVAQAVARDLYFSYKGQLGPLTDHYVLVREDHPAMSPQHSDHVTKGLQDVKEVKWARQQREYKRVSKDLLRFKNKEEEEEVAEEEDELIKYMKTESRKIANDPNRNRSKGIFSCIRFPIGFRRLFKRLRQGNISKLGTFSTRPTPHSQLTKYKGVTKHIALQSKKLSAYEIKFNDPLWTKQWYVQDYRTEDMPVMDHNVVPVYKMGYTGKGVTVGVVDHRIPLDHPDLKRNIDIEKSYDLCLDKPLKEVMDQWVLGNNHGVEVAGVIAMEADNKLCGVGVAYNAKIATINNACKDTKEETEDDAVNQVTQNYEMVDIYNFSFGPTDDAATVCELSDIARKAYEAGVKKGRNGKGIIYFQSAGNGGLFGDNCATDCEINQANVIAITSATQFGKPSDYGELCTAIFATTYSGNMMRNQRKSLERTVTLDLGGKCLTSFAGTSASCPVASGITALLLEYKPELTYRDVMHIIARSAEVAPLANNEGWYMNGQGFWVSNTFGFGLMNAENMINVAKDWETVPEKHTCLVTIKLDTPELLTKDKIVSIPFETKACENSPTENVAYLEHIEVRSIVEYPCRGDIRVNITSPAGTNSMLLDSRRSDTDKDGLEGWPIMSVHNWGENPKGKWIVHFTIDEYPKGKRLEGPVKEFSVTFHGMGVRPPRLEQKRDYATFRLSNGQVSFCKWADWAIAQSAKR